MKEVAWLPSLQHFPAFLLCETSLAHNGHVKPSSSFRKPQDKKQLKVVRVASVCALSRIAVSVACLREQYMNTCNASLFARVRATLIHCCSFWQNHASADEHRPMCVATGYRATFVVKRPALARSTIAYFSVVLSLLSAVPAS